MLLHHSTWSEVESYLDGADGIIIPIGSTEQHGPNGLIGTDAICAEGIGGAIGEATGALVTPTINVGMAQHHMAFSGSMTLRPSTLIAVIRDNVVSLGRHGFRRFYFVNGHGGNVATIQAAFSEIYSESSLARGGGNGELRCTVRNWWIRPKTRELAKQLYGDAEGHHATPSEVSVAQYLRPDFIKQAEMEPAPKLAPSFADSEDYRRRFPDGRIGSDPSLSSPEHGGRLFAAAVEELSADYREFIAES
jgi:creatinine amidohydrolase